MIENIGRFHTQSREQSTFLFPVNVVGFVRLLLIVCARKMIDDSGHKKY